MPTLLMLSLSDTPFTPALPLPALLRKQPLIVISNDPRPGGMRLQIGPTQVTLTDNGFEHLAAILTGCPDPENLDWDFIRYDSGTCEACNLRASVHRIRNCLEAAFGEERDRWLARNIITTIKRGKSYICHPDLRVLLTPSVKQISPKVLRPQILSKLLERFPIEGS